MTRLLKYAVAGIVVGLLLENQTLNWKNKATRKKYEVKDTWRKKMKALPHHA